MTIIVKTPEGQIKAYMKGADSIILQRVTKESISKYCLEKLEDCAKIGLRTLLISQKFISEQNYQKFKVAYDVAKNTIEFREQKMAELQNNLENDFSMIGCTAIEDKLQDDVPEVIDFIRKSGIKLWVLTGDKVSTARNIGFSCKL